MVSPYELNNSQLFMHLTATRQVIDDFVEGHRSTAVEKAKTYIPDYKCTFFKDWIFIETRYDKIVVPWMCLIALTGLLDAPIYTHVEDMESHLFGELEIVIRAGISTVHKLGKICFNSLLPLAICGILESTCGPS